MWNNNLLIAEKGLPLLGMVASWLLGVKVVILRAENEMTTDNTDHKDLRAHGAMLLAMVLFGLMATFSKDVLTHGGITGPS